MSSGLARAASRAKIRVARTGLEPQRPGAIGDAEEAFQQLRDVVVGEPEVAMAPLLLHGDELRIHEPGEVHARRLLGHVGHARKLRSRERLAAQERGEDLGARAIADERRDDGDVGTVFHASHGTGFGVAHSSSRGEPSMDGSRAGCEA